MSDKDKDLTPVHFAPGLMGDGCGFMAQPLDSKEPEGLWEVMDCEADMVCICNPETAVFLHMLLNRVENQIPNGPDVDRKLREMAKEMIETGAGSLLCTRLNELEEL